MDFSKTKDIIERSNFLSESDTTFVAENISRIQADWDKRQMWRTETEMRVSVLNDLKFPTNASKYWQSIKEQSGFYEQLVLLSFQYRRNKLEQKKIVNKIANETDGIERELLGIDLEEKQFDQVNMEQQARERMKEIRLWAKLLTELDDGTFDTEDVNTHQLVSYGIRFENQANNLENATPGEKANVIGQLVTTRRHLEAAGLAHKKADYNAIHKSH